MSEAKKRSHTSDSESSSDDDDDFGPLPSTSAAPSMSTEVTSQQTTKKVMKKRKKLEHEQLFLENLPLSSQYEKSYMHRDNLTHLATSKKYDYIITGSCDGHIKFWKKMLQGIEFVKHFQAHLGAITGMSISPNDQKLVTIGEDRMLKFFDITCYDMSNMISLDYIPGAICWLSSGKSGIYNRVAVSDLNSGIIRIYADDQQTHLEELSFHSHPVRSMDLHVSSGIVISTDSRGMIEYWSSLTFLFPDQSTGITFQMKTETDLYELAKNRTLPCRLTISPRNDYFVITCTDHKIRLFDFYSGKLKKIYNESSEVYAPSPSSSNGGSHGSHGGGTSSAITNNMAASIGGGKYLSEQDLGRRRATEREFESDEKSLKEWNALFDESGNFLIFGTLKGVKVVNLVTNQVCFIIGSSESGERFISLTLYQGTPKVDLQLMLARAAESGKSQTADEFASLIQPDPMLFCTRDVLNEKPREDERVTLDTTANSKLGSEAVIQTDKGEIHIKLFTHECPKTVENFCTHARNGYYDNLIFHRVIKGFMIQTGCPLGDGTGGESIWGGEFGDEFHRNLRHDRPFTVSMANGGPNTNGSQFFITTAPTPWLDNKHTVFGRVTRGYEVVAAIENVEVGSYDKPFQNIVMRHIEIIR